MEHFFLKSGITAVDAEELALAMDILKGIQDNGIVFTSTGNTEVPILRSSLLNVPQCMLWGVMSG